MTHGFDLNAWFQTQCLPSCTEATEFKTRKNMATLYPNIYWRSNIPDLAATAVSYNIKVSRNAAPTWYHLLAEKHST